MQIKALLALALCAGVMICGAWRFNAADRAKATTAESAVATAQSTADAATNAAAAAQATANTASNAAVAAQATATYASNIVAKGHSFTQTFLKGDGTTGTLNVVNGVITNAP